MRQQQQRKRSKVKFRLGKILHWMGRQMEKPGYKLGNLGMNLWDANCLCVNCLVRDARNEAWARRRGGELEEEFFKSLAKELARRDNAE